MSTDVYEWKRRPPFGPPKEPDTDPLPDDGGKIVGTIGMRGKRGWVTIYVYDSGLRRIYKGGLLIGEYEDKAMAHDFARQESGFGG